MSTKNKCNLKLGKIKAVLLISNYMRRKYGIDGAIIKLMERHRRRNGIKPSDKSINHLKL